jgi:predicted transglutaminase-like cysteine proteinase
MRAGMLAAALLISAQTVCGVQTASLPAASDGAEVPIEGAKRIADFFNREKFFDREKTPTRALRGDRTYDATANLAQAFNALRRSVHLVRFDVPALPPMAFTQFCLKYVNECKPQRLVFRSGRVRLTDQRWAELESVNRTVNSSILPKRDTEGLVDQKWSLGPFIGGCSDYAVTKRHELIAGGWPARAVLLSEVVIASGEHHLVAVVRTSDGDLVLDNLTDRIMPWLQKPYQWVRIQTPRNPNYWASISGQGAERDIARRQMLQRFAASLRSGTI